MTDRLSKIIEAGEADHEAVRLQEREAIVAWLRVQTTRGNLDVLCLRERVTLAWHALLNPERLYRGSARYWLEQIESGEHYGGGE